MKPIGMCETTVRFQTPPRVQVPHLPEFRIASAPFLWSLCDRQNFVKRRSIEKLRPSRERMCGVL